MKYEVIGELTFTFGVTVEADSEEEANELVEAWAGEISNANAEVGEHTKLSAVAIDDGGDVFISDVRLADPNEYDDEDDDLGGEDDDRSDVESPGDYYGFGDGRGERGDDEEGDR